jgi:hypothetical protein
MMGGLTRLIPMNSGSVQANELIPIRLGQPMELIPVGIRWADTIDSHEYWVRPA